MSLPENLQGKENSPWLVCFLALMSDLHLIVDHEKSLKLLIIDEVHLLNDERGAVIETIVARTLRQVDIHSLVL